MADTDAARIGDVKVGLARAKEDINYRAMPPGGQTGYVLTKTGAGSYQVDWLPPSGGGGGAVTSVAGKTGAVTLVKGDVDGLNAALNAKVSSGTNAYFEDVHADRGDGTGVIYFGSSTNAFLFFNGQDYILPGADLWINGGRAWTTLTFNPTAKANIADTLNTQTGTTYTLVAADNGRVVEFNNASAVTVTAPVLTVGFNCLIRQIGAGQVSVAVSSTTLRNRQSHTKLAGQWAEASIAYRTTSEFVLSGDTAA